MGDHCNKNLSVTYFLGIAQNTQLISTYGCDLLIKMLDRTNLPVQSR